MSLPPMTTKSPSLEPPELHINEALLAAKLALPINAENFSALIACNYLMAMAARDRKLTRENFQDLLVTTFNFQNRLVRISEVGTLLETLESETPVDIEGLKGELHRHWHLAVQNQMSLLNSLRLFSEMRSAEDPVS